MALNALSIVAGLVVIALALNDVFQSVVMPRATGRRFRLSFYAWRWAWRVWPQAAWRLHPEDGSRREEVLAIFAPFMLLALIASVGRAARFSASA